jgi:tetratricopeptide (TPR) repeat protein
MRLVAADGNICTPKGGIRKALLAVLVLSETRSRGRVRLQDLLWENSSELQGAASLRTALCILRRELRKGLGFDPIEADSQSIRIDTSQLWVDLYDAEAIADRNNDTHNACELLEGINLRGAGGEGFDEWLRDERSRWFDTHNGSTALTIRDTSVEQPDTNFTFEKNTGGIGVGLLPVVVLTGSTTGSLFGDSVLDAVATDLSALANINIYDYRDGKNGTFVTNNGTGPELLLRVRLTIEPAQFALHLAAHLAASQQLVVGGSVTGDFSGRLAVDHYVVSGFIAQTVDRILNWLSQPDNANRMMPNTPYHAMNMMFRFETQAPAIAERMLTKAAADTNEPIYQGLLAYLESFRVGESWGQWDSQRRDRTRDWVDQALSDNPLDCITLCSTGHALGYALHDYPIAGDILRQAVRLSPTQAFCWDHLALHYLYLGKYDQALEAAHRAIQLGAFSPIRFTYETTLCMIATLTGDHTKAVHYGQRALSRRPQFGAAIRYTAISLSHLERLDESRALVRRMQCMDPDFSLKWIDEQDRLALTDPGAKQSICAALRRIGVN